MNNSNPSRRDVLRAGGALAAGAVLGGIGLGGFGARKADAALPDRSASPNRKRVLRLGHLTDVHVQPELAADQGLAACLKHVQELPDKPDVIFNGGDAVMDSLAVGADRTRLLWKLWTDIWRQDCSIPVEHCLGNHDAWGWDKKKSGLKGDEPKYGKQWAMEVLGLERPYRSFGRAGWHFVVLDSVFFDASRVYIGRLDDEQFQWLADDLQKTDSRTPVCIVSHIPIFSAAALFDSKAEGDAINGFRVPPHLMHVDARRLNRLFLQHPNVRMCISGHLHLLERVDYDGVTYLCNGAVSGNWWKGKREQCDAGYALVDLYDDGSFERSYVEYGWKAREA